MFKCVFRLHLAKFYYRGNFLSRCQQEASYIIAPQIEIHKSDYRVITEIPQEQAPG